MTETENITFKTVAQAETIEGDKNSEVTIEYASIPTAVYHENNTETLLENLLTPQDLIDLQEVQEGFL